ncbi:MAG: MerR family DNA-binding transcriptional regulator [Chloroflexi bacterium]|nr:MerR family DNA-binding transcriptional regulator [Chloroflexota bacterium]
MKRDAEVLLMLHERAKGRTQEQAAARAGMSVRTLRLYERRGQLPSQMKQPRTYRSRPDPFAEDWRGLSPSSSAIRPFRARRCFDCCAIASLAAIRRASYARCSATLPSGERSSVPTAR